MRFLSSILLLFFFSATTQLKAADFTNVANGANTNITAHSVCRNVANATGATIFVPHKTSAEWSSVYNNPPSGVTINSCAVNGTCGSATSGAAVSSQPTTNLCGTGTFVEISDTSTQWRWRCNGTGGGANSPTCQRARTTGGSTCTGSDSWQIVGSVFPPTGMTTNLGICTTVPGFAYGSTCTQNNYSYCNVFSGPPFSFNLFYGCLCSSGTSDGGAVCAMGGASGTCNLPLGVSGMTYEGWCTGGSGSCSATCSNGTWTSVSSCGGGGGPSPVNGSCGSAASGGAVSSQPTTNLCSAGTFIELSDTASWWQWRCNGQHGGSNSPTCQRARSSGTWVNTGIHQFYPSHFTCASNASSDPCPLGHQTGHPDPDGVACSPAGDECFKCKSLGRAARRYVYRCQ